MATQHETFTQGGDEIGKGKGEKHQADEQVWPQVLYLVHKVCIRRYC